jgi:hypothetical protein
MRCCPVRPVAEASAGPREKRRGWPAGLNRLATEFTPMTIGKIGKGFLFYKVVNKFNFF